MHGDHDVFMRAIEQKRKLKVTWIGSGGQFSSAGLCVPIESRRVGSPLPAELDSDCYYVWNPTGRLGRRLLRLIPSQIIAMELTEESFDPDEYITPEIET
jgi:hypothetical protein